MQTKIFVTGSNGQLGSEIRQLAPRFTEYIFTFSDRDTLDLGNTDAIRAIFESESFDFILNCAAYTAVDKAESEPDAADKINHLAVKVLAEIAAEKGIAMVTFSTDYVFDGRHYKPYVESDPTAPQGVYGRSKLEGERAMQHINPARSAIMRTSWVYSSFGNNFVKTMLRLGKEREELGVIFDQVGTPTYARDLAEATLALLPKLDNKDVEVYHYSNEGVCSWFDFATIIFELTGIECRVNAIETKAYPTPAVRPHYSLLNKAKIKEAFGLSIPYWKNSLAECLQKLEEEN